MQVSCTLHDHFKILIKNTIIEDYMVCFEINSVLPTAQ